VPFVAKWPGVTTPGGTTDEPTVHVDLYPTFLEVAGAAKPAHPLDGESLVKLFRDPAARLERDAIFQHFPGYLGARAGTWRTTPVSVVQAGRWKLMEFLEDGRLELYDLESDLGETRNRAADMPDMTRRLHERLVAWRREVGAQMPTLNADSAQPVDP
jgi:arylsulfatase A-like enzyme